ncbi:MAG TPA: hypothetical protein VI248_10730 [Kineosporiaceae bacterium]
MGGDDALTGLYVLVAGPDGTGKSTIAHGVEAALRTAGIPVRTSHWRPKVIAGVRSAGPETVDRPHEQPPRSALTAAAKLAVVYADHLIGGHTAWRRARRDAVLIVERGWLDVLVDPRRYRVSRRLAALWARGGRALPKADVALVCAGDSTIIHARKPEIGVAEVGRQCEVWARSAHLAARDVVVLDTVRQPVDAAVRAATDEVLGRLRDGDGWRRVPLTPGRLSVRSRGPFEVSRLYRPHTARARLATAVERRLPLLPRPPIGAPVPGLGDLWTLLGMEPSAVGAMRSSAPGRWILAASSPSGDCVIKVGRGDDAGLRNEARLLSVPLAEGLTWRRPVTLFTGPWRDRFVVATVAEDVRPGEEVPFDTAFELLLGLRHATRDGGPVTHGDFAPWNLVPTAAGPLLLDWEEARVGDEPLWDLTHYLVVSGALLGRYTPATVLDLLTGSGSAGERLLGDTASTAGPDRHVRQYLTSIHPRDARVRRFRDELLTGLGA